MNEELQKALAELVNKSIEMGGNAIAFTQEQLPEVIQQLLMWKMVENLFYAVLAVLWLVILAVAALKIIKAADDSEATAFVIMGGAVSALPGVFGFNIVWLQIWLAPKVYLIEYAASLAK